MARGFVWTDEAIEFLRYNYPKKGRLWCANELGLKESQIRHKSSALGLVARGCSDAWKQAIKDRIKTITGRKRPDQADVMRKAIIEKGLHIPNEKTKAILSEQAKHRILTNGHPKGMLGKTHSQLAKEKMSASGIARAKREGSDVIAERIIKSMKTKAENKILFRPRDGVSWKAGWREIGGQRKYFRSRWEANYARYLQWLKEKGQIQKWEHEPDTFWFEGIKRGCVSYLPDFKITENSGRVVYHEVKGWMDERSKTKIRRMEKYHPSIVLVVIDSENYNKLAKQIKNFINEWE